jgi:hypothetical protein
MTRGESRPPRGPAPEPTTQTAETMLPRPCDVPCYLCRRRPVVEQSELCQDCLDATLTGLRRRRGAALRLPPLVDDGRRDPWQV